MGENIAGNKPTVIRSAKRALCIAEYEARKAGQRGDAASEINLRALVAYIADTSFGELRPEPVRVAHVGTEGL
jgi:hypothetical protein